MGSRAVLDAVVANCLLSYCGGGNTLLNTKGILFKHGTQCTQNTVGNFVYRASSCVPYPVRLHYNVIIRRVFKKFRRSTFSQVLTLESNWCIVEGEERCRLVA